jgi:hypothetical protein
LNKTSFEQEFELGLEAIITGLHALARHQAAA